MGNFVKMLILVILLLPTKACVPIVAMPVGVWVSDDPNIIMYMEPAQMHPLRSRFLAQYTTNGETKNVFVSLHFMQRRLALEAKDRSLNRFYDDYVEIFFTGSYIIKDERLYFTNEEGHHLAGGRKEIIFYKTEDYMLIDPVDWQPDLRFVEGVWKSDEPNITLHFKREYQSPVSPHYLGVYATENGEQKKVFVPINATLNLDEMFMEIHDISSLNIDGGKTSALNWLLPDTWQNYLFPRGSFEIVGDRLYYHERIRDPNSDEIQLITINTIIFYRTDEYTPINPWDWFPDLERRN